MWLARAAQRQDQAWAPGTIANYRSAITIYLQFCFAMGMCPSAPHYYHICAHLEFLTKDTPSPHTIANHSSHIRTYLRKVGVSTSELDHQRVKWAMVAISRNKEYTPRIKLAFPAADLQRMIAALPTTPQGNLIRTSILLMFYAALRQSEVLAPSAPAFDPKKHLTRGDVIIEEDSAVVTTKHAKNMQSVYHTMTVRLQASTNPLLCVVAALQAMVQITPTLSKTDPCTMCPNTRHPISVEYVRRNWNTHLKYYGLSTDAQHCTASERPPPPWLMNRVAMRLKYNVTVAGRLTPIGTNLYIPSTGQLCYYIQTMNI